VLFVSCNSLNLCTYYLLFESIVEDVASIHINTMNTDNTDTENEERYCWLCHEEGRELISGCCSCRGTSGHVHLLCLVKHAQWKTNDAAETGEIKGETLSEHW
jgi:hypothetical protein